jgi:hypothetical protein
MKREKRKVKREKRKVRSANTFHFSLFVFHSINAAISTFLTEMQKKMQG